MKRTLAAAVLGWSLLALGGVRGRAFGSPLACDLYPWASTAEMDPRAKPEVPAAADLPGQENPVSVECRIDPLRLSRGEEGKVVLKIHVRDGMTINALPPFVVEFSPNEELIFPKNFYTASDLNVEVVDDNGRERFNLKKPVEIPFTVNLKAKRDVHVLEGRVKYFATSASGGWCLKKSTKFAATFSTRLTVFRKNG